jgi:hypothetical protein
VLSTRKSRLNQTKRSAVRWAFAEARLPPAHQEKHVGEVLPELSPSQPETVFLFAHFVSAIYKKLPPRGLDQEKDSGSSQSNDTEPKKRKTKTPPRSREQKRRCARVPRRQPPPVAVGPTHLLRRPSLP